MSSTVPTSQSKEAQLGGNQSNLPTLSPGRPPEVIITWVILPHRPAGTRRDRRYLTPLGSGRAQPTECAPWSSPPAEPKMAESTHWCWRTLWGRPGAPAPWWYLVGFESKGDGEEYKGRFFFLCLTDSLRLSVCDVLQIRMTRVCWRAWPSRRTKRSWFCKKSSSNVPHFDFCCH